MDRAPPTSRGVCHTGGLEAVLELVDPDGEAGLRLGTVDVTETPCQRGCLAYRATQRAAPTATPATKPEHAVATRPSSRALESALCVFSESFNVHLIRGCIVVSGLLTPGDDERLPGFGF